ncbi:hypothetical protein V8C42DRAFT_334090 [Trichoderma barbatum]
MTNLSIFGPDNAFPSKPSCRSKRVQGRMWRRIAALGRDQLHAPAPTVVCVLSCLFPFFVISTCLGDAEWDRIYDCALGASMFFLCPLVCILCACNCSARQHPNFAALAERITACSRVMSFGCSAWTRSMIREGNVVPFAVSLAICMRPTGCNMVFDKGGVAFQQPDRPF